VVKLGPWLNENGRLYAFLTFTTKEYLHLKYTNGHTTSCMWKESH